MMLCCWVINFDVLKEQNACGTFGCGVMSQKNRIGNDTTVKTSELTAFSLLRPESGCKLCQDGDEFFSI
jgi:hypothetical protein